MAKPLFFISSTYYDLKNVRDDIDRFLRDLGYDTIRHEVGAVPYSRNEKLESSCYREIENCDVLVCIIGGRYGSSSSTSSGSVTQNELRTAYEQGKQVFVFVERSVHSEWHFYQNNKHVKDAVYKSVNDKRVFEFIDEISQLPTGNPLFSFDTFNEISSVLREQLAGLFKRFLADQSLLVQKGLFEELKGSITTVGELAKLLSEKATQGQDVISQVLLPDHPVFAAIKKATNTRYRVFFTDLTELNQWALSARSLKPVSENFWDSPSHREWVKRETDAAGREFQYLLKVSVELFDDSGRLQPMSKTSWKEDFVSYEKIEIPPETSNQPGESDK